MHRFYCVTQQDKLLKDGASKNQFVKGIVCVFVYIHKTHPRIKIEKCVSFLNNFIYYV